MAMFADVLVPAPASAADPVAQHRVAHDPAADPAGVDPRAHGRDRAGPLVTEAHREAGVPLVEVLHLAGEELDVGAADPVAFHVDDRFPRPRHGRRNLLYGAAPGSVEHEGPHGRSAHRGTTGAVMSMTSQKLVRRSGG